MVISLGPKGPATSSPSWRLSTSGLGEQPASGRFGDCCGEDCPFHPGCPGLVSVALARLPARRSGLSTAGCPARLPGFHQAPLLCAARTFLWRLHASDHPCPPQSSVVNVRTGVSGRQGVKVAGGYIPCHPVTPRPSHPRLVPKGRFELPRGYPHYALNVARLPVPPLRQVDDVPAGCGTGADLRTRTGDLLFTKQLLYQLS
jgi:hypothetical protein